MESPDKTILLVEDEHILALMETRVLRNEGYNVIHASNGAAAVKIVRDSPESIDLILMDIDLGDGMDGTETAREILRDNDIPIIFLSSHTEMEIIEKTEQITSYGYIVKGSGHRVMIASIKMAFKLYYAHRKLFQSEQRFRLLVENAPTAISVCLDGTTVYSNKVFAQILGCEDPEEFIGRSVTEHLTPESGAKVMDMIKRRAKGEPVPSVYEVKAVRKNGEVFNMLTRACSVQIAEGMASVAFFTDLTDYYKMIQDLKESEERLRCVIEGGNIGFWDLNLETGKAFRNKQWSDMLGLSADDLDPNYNQWLSLIHPDDRDRIIQSVGEHMNGVLPIHANEYRILNEDGSFKWIYDRGMIIKRDENGKPLRMCGIVLDITERKASEARLKHYTEELRKSNETKDKLFSVLSHDLRNPFFGFLGLTKEMADNIDGLEKKEISEIANIMYNSSSEMFALLTNLLEWSRIQTGRYVFESEVFEPYQEVESLRKLFSTVSAQKNIRLVNNINKDLSLETDRNAITAVLRNLIDNALKFSGEGGIVKIDSAETDKYVEISVTDSGIGLSQETAENLFISNSVNSTKGTKGEKGSGLGLLLCKDFIYELGGEIIAANNETGRGSRFSFTLPR